MSETKKQGFDAQASIVSNNLAHVTSMHNYSSVQPNCIPNPSPIYSPTKRSRNDYSKSSKKSKYIRGNWSNRQQYNQQYKRANSYGSSSRSSSDSEDGLSEGSKRAQHNVLERKRRNDLKSSFMRLREVIPELLNQERAAKVVILKKATDYIYQLQQEDTSLLVDLSHQKRKQERLKNHIKRLQEDSLYLY